MALNKGEGIENAIPQQKIVFDFGHRRDDESNAYRVALDMESIDTNTHQRHSVPLEQRTEPKRCKSLIPLLI